MTPLRRAATLAGLALAGFAAVFAATEVGARPKKPAAVEAPPEPPPMPGVALGERFISDAAAYQSYMRQSVAISPNFQGASDVAQSLRAGVAYEPAQFLRGELAYAAIAALQDHAFVAAVRSQGATPEQRYAIVSRLYANPANVLAFQGAQSAAGLAKQALTGDGMRLYLLGKAVRQQAFDIQHQAWSKEDVAGRDERLQAVKSLSATPRAASDAELASLRQAVTADPGAASAGDPPAPAPPPYSPLVVRAVALAALAAIGQAGDADAERLSWLAQDYFTEHCLDHAKKELNECLAVARPNYEDIFCLGEPTLLYTGECVVKGAGGYVPLEIATRPIPAPPIHRAAVVKHRRHR